MTHRITTRQATVLDFIKSFIHERGFPPTIREIASHLGITSLKAVERHLEALEKKQCIRRTGGISRAIEVINERIGASVKEIPIVGTVQAGKPILAVEHIEATVALDSSFVRWDDVFFLRVQGNSMIEAHIMEGDLALVRPQPDAENGEIVVALIGDEATLKVFYREQSGVIRLQPANSEMEPLFIHDDEPPFRLIGKVVGIFRESHHITAFRKRF